jgi:hypothetical protein
MISPSVCALVSAAGVNFNNVADNFFSAASSSGSMLLRAFLALDHFVHGSPQCLIR